MHQPPLLNTTRLTTLPPFASQPCPLLPPRPHVQSSPHTAVEALISINNQLRQPDAAVGVLNVAQKELHMDLKESWWVGVAGWRGVGWRGLWCGGLGR